MTPKKRLTLGDRFLAEIESVTPWMLLMAELEPFYAKGEDRRRPPISLEKMLSMYIAQQCFGFSNEAIEDALYDSQAIRRFVGVDLRRESAPDATVIAAPAPSKNRDRARDLEMHQTKKGHA